MKVFVFLVAIATCVLASKEEVKHREHHSSSSFPQHEKSLGNKAYKHYLQEKKGKEGVHHKSYLRDDKHVHGHKGVKHPIEVPPHEAYLQADLKASKNGKDHHESWHKKDAHLQDLSFDTEKGHHVGHGATKKTGHKSHHSRPQHAGPVASRLISNGEEHNSEHHAHNGHRTSDFSTPKGHQQLPRPARPLLKSFHRPEHTESHPHQTKHENKKSHSKEERKGPWGKGGNKKKAYEKKQKVHRKKQFKGELHKLW